MFGSSANGFGSKDSDLDICLTLPGHDKVLYGTKFWYHLVTYVDSSLLDTAIVAVRGIFVCNQLQYYTGKFGVCTLI